MVKDNVTPQGLDTLLDLNGVVIGQDKGIPYEFQNADQLMQDFLQKLMIY